MSKVLVIAPHGDDETYGVGGTLLRHRNDGDSIHWLLVTSVLEQHGYSADEAEKRARTVQAVRKYYGFSDVAELGLPPAGLDQIPRNDLVGAFVELVDAIRPEIVYLPYPGDVHTDHRAVFEAGVAATKAFRCPSVRSVRAYETLSETDFGIDPTAAAFRPNLFMDISDFLAQKLEALDLYPDELGTHPFPRSMTSVEALARLRGSAIGVEAAEAFMLLRERR